MKIQLIAASHQPYWMPSDPLYLPLFVGSAGADSIAGFSRDDTGENISARNKSFCELTGIYWAWKNIDADYIGLVHYRRYFAGRFSFSKKKRIASLRDFERALHRADVILPRSRRYFIETNYSQYAHAHYEQDLLLTRDILQEKYPQYLPAWERVMRRTHGHRYNIFVMKRPLLDQYLTWLFDVLFTLEQRLDTGDYAGVNKRVFGLVSERLIDIWIECNQVRYVELPVVNLENQHWPRKIFRFLMRKFRARGAIKPPPRRKARL